MPTAAAVPIAVETSDAITARMSVFLSALSVSASRNSSWYHLNEKPENTDRLFASLNENTSRIAIGANRNTKMRAV